MPASSFRFIALAMLVCGLGATAWAVWQLHQRTQAAEADADWYRLSADSLTTDYNRLADRYNHAATTYNNLLADSRQLEQALKKRPAPLPLQQPRRTAPTPAEVEARNIERFNVAVKMNEQFIDREVERRCVRQFEDLARENKQLRTDLALCRGH